MLPLYALLFALTWSQASLDFALRLALPGALLSMILLRLLYPMCVGEPPLSVEPTEVTAKMDWTGTLMTLALGLTIVAVLAYVFVTTILIGIGVAVMLVAVEWTLDRKAQASIG